LARVQNCRTIVLDFDRCAGVLTFKNSFERPAFVFAGGGAAFSENARYLAITEQVAIISVDLDKPNPVFDTLVPLDSLIGRSLQTMARAPNGYWYLNQPHRGRYMPELRRLDMPIPGFFSKKGLLLPVYNVRSLPYFPNFRLYDLPGSICDTLGIDTPVSTYISFEDVGKATYYPNPVREMLHLNIDIKEDYDKIQFQLYDIYGRVVLDKVVEAGASSIFVGDLPNQIYFANLMIAGKPYLLGKVTKIK
jgi:hypothetical protein